jgi:hypothetical protein
MTDHIHALTAFISASLAYEDVETVRTHQDLMMKKRDSNRGSWVFHSML